VDIIEIKAVTAGGDQITACAPSEEMVELLLNRWAVASLGAEAAQDPAAIAKFMTMPARLKVQDFLILHLNIGAVK
jgi:hypothetical protein